MSIVQRPALHLINNDEYEPASQIGRTIQQTWAEKKNYLSNSASDWAPTVSAALRTIQNECRFQNWDSEGAMPVVDTTMVLTKMVVEALFRLLPKVTPSPDLIPESDGEICISWSVDSTHIFSLSIGDQRKINFAGQFGNEGSVHAWQPIDTKSLSAIEASLADVIRYINRLYEPSPIRSAA